MKDLKRFAALQARVYEFLERQDEGTLSALIEGTAQLAVVDRSPTEAVRHEDSPADVRSQSVVAVVEPSRDPGRVARELSPMSSEQRRSYLSATTLTLSELRNVAKQLRLRQYSKLAKNRLVEALINHGSGPADPGVDQPDSPARPTAAASIAPAEPNVAAAQIASRLREIDTEDEGATYLRAQQLDKAALLAVATELHLTRVDRLSRTELEKRVLKQAIGARRKFAGLRKW